METKADLADAEARLSSLIASISGDPTRDQMHSIWVSYVDLEKSIVFVRVEIDEENPGRFISPKRYKVPDERQALQFSLKHLRRGSQSFAAGDYIGSLRDLREARNYLRVLLRESSRPRARRR